MFMNYEPETPEPTLILCCEVCGVEIYFYGDGSEDVRDGFFTLGEHDMVNCDCGAMYREGDELEVR